MSGVDDRAELASGARSGGALQLATDTVGRLPERIGRFEILRVLGVGGFAIVYLARDQTLNRQVALKVPRWHTLSSDETRARFVREAQATARLDHPHIAPTYEAGTDGELPYLAIAYCSGPTLAEWIKRRDRPVAPRTSARVVAELAAAVQYSHEHGVLHRDIKPGNVLLFPVSGSSDEDGGFPYVPRLCDFGLAKVLEGEGEFTTSSMLLGTPLYMSPEQALGHHGEVGPWSDVYGLGGVLYCLLTGRPPFRAGGMVDTLRLVAEWDPIPPIALQPDLDPDLSVICLKCLEKQPASRYGTAQDLAEDLYRYLAGETIRAKPATTWDRCWRWCCRKPVLAGLLASVLCLAVCLIVTLLWHSYASTALHAQIAERNQELNRTVAQLNDSLHVATQQQRLAEANGQRVAQLLYAADLQLAAAAIRRSDLRDAGGFLTRHARGDKEFAFRHLWNQLHPPRELVGEAGQKIWYVAYSPDGRWLAAAGNRGRVDVFDGSAKDRLCRTFDTGQIEVNSLAFSLDGEFMATAGDDGRLVLWAMATGEIVHSLQVMANAKLFGVAFLNEGRQIVACGQSPDLSVWDTTTGTLVKSWKSPHPRTIESLAVSPDGQRLASAGAEGIVAVFRVGEEQPQLLLTADDHGRPATVVAFSRDGQWIVTGSRQGMLVQFDAATGQRLRYLRRPEPIVSIVVNQHGALACGDGGGVICQLDMNGGHQQLAAEASPPWEPQRIWLASPGRIGGLAFSPDGESVVSGDDRGQLYRWKKSEPQRTVPLPRRDVGEWSPYRSLVTNARSQSVYLCSPDGLKEWDRKHQQLTDACAQGHFVTSAAPLGDAALLLGDARGRIAIANQDLEPSWRDVALLQGYPVYAIGSYAAGQRLVARNAEDVVVVLDAESGQVQTQLPDATALALSSDERWLAVARSPQDDLLVLDTETLQPVAACPPHATGISHVEFSSDGRLLLSASHDRTAIVRDTRNWEVAHVLLGHEGRILSAAISSDNRTIATGDDLGTIKLWDAASGQELHELPRAREPVGSLVFAPDNEFLHAILGHVKLATFAAPHHDFLATPGPGRPQAR